MSRNRADRPVESSTSARATSRNGSTITMAFLTFEYVRFSGVKPWCSRATASDDGDDETDSDESEGMAAAAAVAARHATKTTNAARIPLAQRVVDALACARFRSFDRESRS